MYWQGQGDVNKRKKFLDLSGLNSWLFSWVLELNNREEDNYKCVRQDKFLEEMIWYGIINHNGSILSHEEE